MVPLLLFVRLDLHPKSSHPSSTMINITPTQLRKAADIQEKIQSLQKELGQLLGGSGPASVEVAAPKAPKNKKRKMSAQGLANIRAGVAKRMAAQQKAAMKPSQPKHKISAAGKARLAALAKARWAKVKKAGKSRL